MKRRTILALLVLLIGVFAFAAVGCGGDDDEGDDAGPAETGGGGGEEVDLDLPPVTALPSASCTDIEYGGEGDPDILIASDLPLQGASRRQNVEMAEAIKYLLRERDFKAGDFNIA